jgi:chromosome segregation ATPase
MSEHYKGVQHQNAIMDLIRHLLFKSSSDQYDRGSGMDTDILPHLTTSLHDNANEQLQEIYETIDTLAGGIQTLNEDAQRLSNESLRLKNTMDVLAQDFASLKLSIQEQNAFLDGIKPNQEILQQDVASLKQKLEDMQSLSYDGTLTWKISNFKKKMGKFFTIFDHV